MKNRSIIHKQDGTCYLCLKLYFDYRTHKVLHKHHVFGGPNRNASEQEGFYCWLCLEHHVLGPEAVHNNISMMRLLQRDAQRKYEETHTREEFMAIIGRNFLDWEE